MDGPRDDTKSERERQMSYHLYVESKTWYKWTYLQNRNRLTDIEKRLVGAKAGQVGEGWTGSLGVADTNYYIERMDRQDPTVQHREL